MKARPYPTAEERTDEPRALRARGDAYEGALRRLLHAADGMHVEECNAYGADDDEATGEEGGSDPYCWCGATAARNAARAALKGETR